MHAPAHICKALYQTHKYLRLAWMGAKQRNDDDLNRGTFVVVQLLHVIDAGPIWNPKTIKELWDVETYQTEAGSWDIRPVWRGPIFNRFGGLSPDWDPLIRRPVISLSCHPSQGLSTQSVFDGSIVSYIRRNMKSARERIKEHVDGEAQRGRALDNKMQELTSEMRDALWFEATKTASSGPIIAKKHIDDSQLAKLKRLREGRGFSFEKYLTDKVPAKMRAAVDQTNLRFE